MSLPSALHQNDLTATAIDAGLSIPTTIPTHCAHSGASNDDRNCLTAVRVISSVV